MSGIHQMQVSFVPVEDRLLFLLLTQDYHEFKFWFTRRYTKILWGLLQHSLYRDTTAAANPLHQQAMRSFEHEQAIAGADFNTPYYAPAVRHHPLGTQAIVAAKASLRQHDSGKQILSIHPEQGKGIDINLEYTLLHAFAKLISDALRHSDWDLNYIIASSTTVPDKRMVN
jgi:hypothetical protein